MDKKTSPLFFQVAAEECIQTNADTRLVESSSFRTLGLPAFCKAFIQHVCRGHFWFAMIINPCFSFLIGIHFVQVSNSTQQGSGGHQG